MERRRDQQFRDQPSLFGGSDMMAPKDPPDPIQGQFFNTSKLSPEELEVARQQANRQEIAIYEIYERDGTALTPWDVAERLELAIPITSVRRAITSLTHSGLLRKTDEQRPGPYGSPSHCWIVNK